MSQVLNAIRPVALKVIQRFGKSFTLVYSTRGAYDPATGTAAATETTKSVKGIVEEYSQSEIGGVVQAGDVKITIPAEGLTEPQSDDRLRDGTDEYQVVHVEPIGSVTAPVLYQIQARR